MDTPSIVARFVEARPVIQDMMKRAGTVGLSYGVIHGGHLIHVDSFGFRDHAEKLPIDEETIMPICSMSKALFVSVLGDLVHQGKLHWDAKVHDVLPGFAPRSTALAESSTLLDYLSMKSGIESYNVWTQSYNRINFAKSDSLKIINTLDSVQDLRTGFAYNNWGYEVVDLVYEAVTGHSWTDDLHASILDPLGCTRTDARGDRDQFDNVAQSYLVLDDCTPVRVPTAYMSRSTLMGAAGGVVSCIKDLVPIYQAMLKACLHQFETGSSSTPRNPFKNLAKIMSAHTPLPGTSLRESSYGLAWIRTQLPNQMCKIGSNYSLLGDTPVVGKLSAPKLVIVHYGSMPGNFSSVNLFPESQSGIILLTNTTPMCDMADWVTQLLTQTLFDFPEKISYPDWVQRTVDAELAWHQGVEKEMKCDCVVPPSVESLSPYPGRYYNASMTLFIEVRIANGGLQLSFDGRDDDIFPLKFCKEDVFSWLLPRNELIRRGRLVLQPAPYYQIFFSKGSDGAVDKLFWKHDPSANHGECYKMKGAGSV